MLIKEIAHKTIDELPNDVGYNDIIYALYVKSKFEEGLKDLNNGKTLNMYEVENRLSKWLK
jgi:hypothetical protein